MPKNTLVLRKRRKLNQQVDVGVQGWYWHQRQFNVVSRLDPPKSPLRRGTLRSVLFLYF